MKKYILTCFILISILSFSWAQNHQKCGHRMAFDKSPLSDSLDVLSYHIFIDSINWNEDILYARTQLIVQSKIEDLGAIPLELMNFTIDHVFIDGMETTDFEMLSPRLTINLASAINTGDELELWIQYHGVPFKEGWGGFYIDNQYAYNLGVGFDADPHNLGKAWFPCVDDFHDRAVYDVTARVHDPLVVVAGGLLQEVTDHGDGTKSYHWHLENTIPTYLASVAIGNYQIYEDTYEGIDVNIPIQIYARPSQLNQVEASFIHLKEILSYFENSFGAYPFSRVGYVSTSIGAMEHATNVAYPSFAINGQLTYEDLYTHELSHMWFGDQVTCESAEDMWLNEGWATFCQMYYTSSVYGEEEYRTQMRHHHKEVLRSTHFTDGDYLALYGISHEYTYGSTVYDKGATVVQSLRGYLGDDVFFPAVKEYLNTYAYNYASSENMRDFISNYTGVDMTDFFQDYVFTPGFSHFSVDSIHHVSGNDYQIHISQKLKGKDVYANNNKVEVTLMDGQWNQQEVIVHFNGQSGFETFTLDFEPLIAMVDLHENFSDASTDMIKTIKDPGTYNFTDCYFNLEVENVPDSAFFRITHNWVAPDELQLPLEGLTLSDYRYYTVDGILPESLEATGVFRYTMSGKLDHTLLGNVLDSIVMLYKPNAASDWQAIEFEQDGTPFAGYMRIPHLQRGHYTLAVWDEQFVKVKNPVELSADDYLQTYPNPSNGRVYFDLIMPDKGRLEVYDTQGKQIDSIAIQAHQSSAKWDGRRMPKGSYLIRLVNENGVELSIQKVILQ